MFTNNNQQSKQSGLSKQQLFKLFVVLLIVVAFAGIAGHTAFAEGADDPLICVCDEEITCKFCAFCRIEENICECEDGICGCLDESDETDSTDSTDSFDETLSTQGGILLCECDEDVLCADCGFCLDGGECEYIAETPANLLCICDEFASCEDCDFCQLQGNECGCTDGICGCEQVLCLCDEFASCEDCDFCQLQGNECGCDQGICGCTDIPCLCDEWTSCEYCDFCLAGNECGCEDGICGCTEPKATVADALPSRFTMQVSAGEGFSDSVEIEIIDNFTFEMVAAFGNTSACESIVLSDVLPRVLMLATDDVENDVRIYFSGYGEADETLGELDYNPTTNEITYTLTDLGIEQASEGIITIEIDAAINLDASDEDFVLPAVNQAKYIINDYLTGNSSSASVDLLLGDIMLFAAVTSITVGDDDTLTILDGGYFSLDGGTTTEEYDENTIVEYNGAADGSFTIDLQNTGDVTMPQMKYIRAIDANVTVKGAGQLSVQYLSGNSTLDKGFTYETRGHGTPVFLDKNNIPPAVIVKSLTKIGTGTFEAIGAGGGILVADGDVTVSAGTLSGKLPDATKEAIAAGIYVFDGNMTVTGGSVHGAGGGMNVNGEVRETGCYAEPLLGGIVVLRNFVNDAASDFESGKGQLVQTGGSIIGEAYGIAASAAILADGMIEVSGANSSMTAFASGGGPDLDNGYNHFAIHARGIDFNNGATIYAECFPFVQAKIGAIYAAGDTNHGLSGNGSFGSLGISITGGSTVTAKSKGAAIISEGDIYISGANTVGQLPTQPRRTNYRFEGWNTRRDGSGETFTANTPVYGNMTVYAQWLELPYTLTFDLNGAPGRAPEPQLLYAGETASAVANPTRAGYNFLGWYTARNGGTRVIVGSYVMPNHDVTLYAHWEKQPGEPEKPTKPPVDDDTILKPGDGGYIEIDKDGNPSGVWTEDDGKWTFEEYSPKTGDESALLPYMLAAIASGGVVLLIILRKRKNRSAEKLG